MLLADVCMPGLGFLRQQPPPCLLDRCQTQGHQQLARGTEEQLLRVGRSTSPPTRAARGRWVQAQGELPARGAPGTPASTFHRFSATGVPGTQRKVGARYLDSESGSGWVSGQRAGGMYREQQAGRMEKADPECPLGLAECRKVHSVIAENSLSVTWLGFVCCRGMGGIYTPATASGTSPQPNTKIG